MFVSTRVLETFPVIYSKALREYAWAELNHRFSFKDQEGRQGPRLEVNPTKVRSKSVKKGRMRTRVITSPKNTHYTVTLFYTSSCLTGRLGCWIRSRDQLCCGGMHGYI